MDSTSIDEQNAEDIWQSLKCGLLQIQEKTSSHLSFEELYRNAYTIILHRYGSILYEGLHGIVTEHVENQLKEITFFSHNFLQKLTEVWNDHQTTMRMIRDVLMYVDRVYVTQNNVENVYNVGLIIFRDQIKDKLSFSLQQALIDDIIRDRNGEAINRSIVKTMCQMLMTLGLGTREVYETVFEGQFLIESANFFKMESQRLLMENSTTVYIRKVEQWINEEIERTQQCLDSSTQSEIVTILEQELIIQQLPAILEIENFGLSSMLKNKETENIICLFKVVSRVKQLPVLIEFIGSYLEEEGKGLVTETGENRRDGVVFIREILNLKDYCDYLLEHVFNENVDFKKMIANSFEKFMNLNPKFPEYLSLYIDAVLRKDNKCIQGNDIEQNLNKAMVLFKLMIEKDMFERYYKIHLAKRLLFDKIISDDSEKSMISKLKTECGLDYTLKFEGMFRDMHVSRTVMEDFKIYAQGFSEFVNNIDLNVYVLSAGMWPVQMATKPCIIPSVASDAFQAFKHFYFERHSGRQLTLQPQLGSVDLTAVFYGSKDNNLSKKTSQSLKKKTLSVTTYQMLILLLFNKRDIFTFQEIIDETDIPECDLLKAIQSLALGKLSQRILIKQPKTKNIEKSDTFCVNDSFTSALQRIKIKAISSSDIESPDKCKETRSKVEGERRFEIEAAIVRVMKERKELPHSILVAEVTGQLKHRFFPKPEIIKKRIECLIEKEYLQRTPNDRKKYVYIT